MPRRLEFFFDFGSPNSYLAYTQLPRLAAECDAELVWRPFLLGGVFKSTGNASPMLNAAKARWMAADIKRWARKYGVPFRFNPAFPVNTLALMRGAIGLQMRQPAQFPTYVDTVFNAMWVNPVNLGDPTVLGATLTGAGLDASAINALVNDPEIKASLIASTEEAVTRGAFGAPTMFVGDEMFFGQDRLDFVREALRAA